jgi:Trk K+ transport system NAD-binding subunit
VFQSSGLDIDILEEAGLDSMGTFLAMTSNGEVNSVLAQRAAEEFQPPRVLAVFPRDPQSNTTTNNTKVNQAFVPQLSIKSWNQYLNDGQVKLGQTTLKESGLAFQRAHLQALIRSGELLPLLVERESSFQVVPATETWQAGDRIIYLLHDPRPKLLKRLSGASPSTRLALEKLPEVEEVPISAALSSTPVEEMAQ